MIFLLLHIVSVFLHVFCSLQKMGKKNRSNAKADKGKPSFQDQLKIKDLVKNLLASEFCFSCYPRSHKSFISFSGDFNCKLL